MATVQLYNIFTLHNLMAFWAQYAQGNIVLNLVNYPEDLSIDLLDSEGRDLAGASLASYEKFFATETRLAHVYDRLAGAEPENVEHLRSQWAKRTQALDTVRQTSVARVHQLGKYLEKWQTHD